MTTRVAERASSLALPLNARCVCALPSLALNLKKMRDAHSRLRRGHLVKLLYPSWYPYVTEYFSSFVLFSRMEID